MLAGKTKNEPLRLPMISDWEVGQQIPVAKGRLRASRRKLDPEKSLHYRPYRAYNERRRLKPGGIVECEIEIWHARILVL
jgi:hypothetical protein